MGSGKKSLQPKILTRKFPGGKKILQSKIFTKFAENSRYQKFFLGNFWLQEFFFRKFLATGIFFQEIFGSKFSFLGNFGLYNFPHDFSAKFFSSRIFGSKLIFEARHFLKKIAGLENSTSKKFWRLEKNPCSQKFSREKMSMKNPSTTIPKSCVRLKFSHLTLELEKNRFTLFKNKAIPISQIGFQCILLKIHSCHFSEGVSSLKHPSNSYKKIQIRFSPLVWTCLHTFWLHFPFSALPRIPGKFAKNFRNRFQHIYKKISTSTFL